MTHEVGKAIKPEASRDCYWAFCLLSICRLAIIVSASPLLPSYKEDLVVENIQVIVAGAFLLNHSREIKVPYSCKNHGGSSLLVYKREQFHWQGLFTAFVDLKLIRKLPM